MGTLLFYMFSLKNCIFNGIPKSVLFNRLRILQIELQIILLSLKKKTLLNGKEQKNRSETKTRLQNTNPPLAPVI
jgi:hypothetical protein